MSSSSTTNTNKEPLDDVLSPTEAASYGRVVTAALAGGQLTDAAPAALFMDTAAFQAECRALVSSFPDSALHGFAVKACPVVGVLKAAAAAGMGGECASEGEVALCVAAGMPAERIVLDSPCKTDTLLRKMLHTGVHINADNLDEVARIHSLLQQDEFKHLSGKPPSVGLRINPQIGSGTIGMTSTAGTDNKFGVPLKDQRDVLVEAYCNTYQSFLTGVHVHVGSQGVSPQQLVDGAKAVVELAQEINTKAGKKQVTTVDIGGGLSVYYGPSAAKNGMISMETYATMLRDQVPALFDFRIITELGRRMVAPYGFLATRVQTIKRNATRTYVVGHVGADLLMRDVYAAAQWRHAIHVYNAATQSFRGSNNGTARFHVAGPLCFSGDIIAKDRVLPADVQEGDVLVMPMSGAYTISMYSRHTSQLVPAVYGYDGGDGDAKIEFATLKKAETLEDLVRFWGG